MVRATAIAEAVRPLFGLPTPDDACSESLETLRLRTYGQLH